MMKKFAMIMAAALMVCSVLTTVSAATPENIFTGEIGKIEQLDSNAPTAEYLLSAENWVVWSDQSQPPYTGNISIDKTVSKLGGQSIKMTNEKVMGHTCAYYRMENVTAGNDYTLVFSAKTEDVVPGMSGYGGIAFISFRDADGNEIGGLNTLDAAYMTSDWTDRSLVFNVPENVDTVLLNLTLWAARGTIWYDDIRIYEGVIADTTSSEATFSAETSSVAEVSSAESSSPASEATSSVDDIFEEKPIDTSSASSEEDGGKIWPFILIGGIAVIVIAGVVVTVIVLKKKKEKS